MVNYTRKWSTYFKTRHGFNEIRPNGCIPKMTFIHDVIESILNEM